MTRVDFSYAVRKKIKTIFSFVVLILRCVLVSINELYNKFFSETRKFDFTIACTPSGIVTIILLWFFL